MDSKASISQFFEISTDRQLDFAKADTFYATHRMHSFSAKFPPQLADWGVDNFSAFGDWVLDPFVGSGTLLVEARLRGRNSLGLDIDPLSRLMSKVKSTPIDQSIINKQFLFTISELHALKKALRRARENDTVDQLLKDYQVEIPEFPNRDYWFLRPVQEELALLKALIKRHTHPDFIDFLCVVFSAIIITKGKTSVANVRDLAHSRPHYVKPEETPDTLEQFKFKLEQLTRNLIDFSNKCYPQVESRVLAGDARKMNLPNASVDLVFTSPPYVNAIDYPRAHKFSIFWLEEFLHISPDNYVTLGRDFIGTDRIPSSQCKEDADYVHGVPLLDETIRELKQKDYKSAGVTSRYFIDMQAAISEMTRVLRPNRNAVIVVCPSAIKGITVETHQILAMIAEQTSISNPSTGKSSSFEVMEIAMRLLDDSKRQLPFLRGNNGPGMKNEYVIILTKREK